MSRLRLGSKTLTRSKLCPIIHIFEFIHLQDESDVGCHYYMRAITHEKHLIVRSGYEILNS